MSDHFVWCSSVPPRHKQFSRARLAVASTKVSCSLSAQPLNNYEKHVSVSYIQLTGHWTHSLGYDYTVAEHDVEIYLACLLWMPNSVSHMSFTLWLWKLNPMPLIAPRGSTYSSSHVYPHSYNNTIMLIFRCLMSFHAFLFWNLVWICKIITYATFISMWCKQHTDTNQFKDHLWGH